MAVQTWIYGKPDVQYAGCVLDTYEHNGYHDSDWYAVCWDEDKQKVVEVEYDTTRCGSGGKAEIDATDDILAKVYRHYFKIGKDLFDSRTNIEQAKSFDRGDTIVVVRGRKIPKGTKGKVFWIGNSYNRFNYQNETRVGIEVNGVRMFLPIEYCERENWQEYLITGKERKRKIRSFAINSMPAHYRARFVSWPC